MKPRDVEIWAGSVLAQFEANHTYESALVELKADWPTPQKTARRLGGHANAARGNNILWLIGVDEKRGVVGASANDLATWYPQVCAEFDHVAPDVTDVVIDWQGKIVSALGFETDRATVRCQERRIQSAGRRRCPTRSALASGYIC